MDQLFEHDWEFIMKPSFKDEEELEEVKMALKDNYWLIREVYKYNASYGTPAGNTPFAVSMNQYFYFCRQAKLLKNKSIIASELDTLFLMMNKRYQCTPLNPGTSIIRYQFLEVIMRIGLKKCRKYESSDTAIRNFIQYDMKPTLKVMKSQDFRDHKYWNEYVDNLYKFHGSLLDEIYRTYSGTRVRPGDDNFMHPSEFERMYYDAKLQSTRFSYKDLNYCYNFAMQSQIDENESWRHLQMNYLEFLEAIGRMADMLSYPPPTDNFKNEYLKQIEGDDDSTNIQVVRREMVEMTEEECLNQPLHKKIENILPNLLLYCTNKAFKRRWNWPRKNPKYGLFEKAKKTVNEVKNIVQRGMQGYLNSNINIKKILENKKKKEMQEI